MYERKEHIEEENLDWGEQLEKIDDSQTDAETKESKPLIDPATEENKTVFQKKFKFTQVNIKRAMINLLDQYAEISLLLSFSILPYVIGFFVIAFILLSGGVPIDRFFSLKEGIFHFELWSIGSYIFITSGMIWLVTSVFLDRR